MSGKFLEFFPSLDFEHLRLVSPTTCRNQFAIGTEGNASDFTNVWGDHAEFCA
jgi:hypothetical protein